MKHQRFCLFFLLSGLLFFLACDRGCSSTVPESQEKEQELKQEEWGADYFKIQFVQEGKLVTVTNGKLLLNKAPFSLRFRMREIPGVYLHTCPDLSNVYSGGQAPTANELFGKALAGSPANEDYEMIIHCDGFNYLREDVDGYRTFNRIQREGNELEAILEIHNLYYALEEAMIRVEDIEEDLLLNFYAITGQEADSYFDILQQNAYHIRWQ